MPMHSRRDFLQKLTATAFTIPLVSGVVPEVFAQPKDVNQNEKVLKVAIMGLGSYANRVADAMKDCKRAKVTGVISGTPSKIKDWQARFNIPDKNCYNYENFDAIKKQRGH